MLPPLMALSTPLAPWFNWVLAIVKLAPSPRIRALLVAEPVVDSTMPALLLAIQEPLFTTASAPPPPIWPAPCTVMLLPKVAESPAPVAAISRFWMLFDMLMVAVPPSVRAPSNWMSVKLPTEPMLKTPL